jgi:hypothetical protein
VAENAETRRNIREEYFEPDQIERVFTGALCCANCGEMVVFSSNGGVDREVVDEDGRWEWVNFYVPHFFYPALKLIEMPESKSVPADMREAIAASFAVFWSNLTRAQIV